jgi:hypothetical protein
MKLTMSLKMLWNAQISRAKKFFLIMLFSGGVFVMMAGILRTYFILTGGREGGKEAAYWGTREAFVAFVIGNAPMIYGGMRIWLRKFKDSKSYARLQSRTQVWPRAKRISALFSWAAHSKNRSASEKRAPGKTFATRNTTETSSPSSEQSNRSPIPWQHDPYDGHIDTNVERRDSARPEPDPEFGIQVARGIKVDVESVQSRDSDPETIQSSAEHSRTG